MNAERGEAVAGEIGGVFARVDVSDEASLDAGFAKARAAHGQERVLVNCAGIATIGKLTRRDRETGAISHHPVRSFVRTLMINLVGTFQCTAKAAMGMMSSTRLADGERGVMINTASVAAQDGQIGQVAYASSKAGVKGMTLPVARDLMSEGIRVNAHPARHFPHPDDGQPSGKGAGVARRIGAFSQTAGRAGGICRAGLLHGRERNI